MKILIVDDEALVRIGMRSIIKWEEQGFDIVGEADNGETALELCKKEKPDIILVDILMPKMNGFEFIKRAKNENPLCKFIILSCLNEIATYQESIKLGVQGYILKDTITPEQILSEVMRVAEDVKSERVFTSSSSMENRYINENVVLNEFASLVIKGKIIDQDHIKDKLLKSIVNSTDNKIYLMIFEKSQDNKMQLDRNFHYKIAAFIQDMIITVCSGHVFVSHDDIIWALVGYKKEEHPMDLIGILSERILATINQYFFGKMIIGIKEIDSSDLAIKDNFEMCQRIMNQAFFMCDEVVFYYSLTESYISLKKELYEMLEGFTSSTDSFQVIKEFETLYEYFKKYPIFSKIEVSNIYASIINNLMLKEEKIFSNLSELIGINETVFSYLLKCSNFEEVHGMAINLVFKFETYHGISYEDTVIQKIITYIMKHLDQKITLNDLANEVHMSSEYTCRYFKLKTKVTLTDFILMKKIQVSKRDLIAGKSISEIAELFGFSSGGHYIKTFKKYEGMTPGTYIRH